MDNAPSTPVLEVVDGRSCDSVVETLRAMLERAERGELRAVVVLYRTQIAHGSERAGVWNYGELSWTLSREIHKMHRECDE